MDAIQSDVSKVEEDVVEEVLSPRELAMQEIAEQIASQQAPAPVVEEVEEKPAPSATMVDSDMRVKVKVDGQELELPLSEVTKGYQKDAVASRRLAQAAEERKMLDARQRELEERENRLTASPSATPVDGDADVDAQIKAAMSALVDGDEDAATEALKAVIKGRGTTTPQVIDEEALVARAAQRIEEKRIVEENAKAWEEFTGTSPAFADETSKERQYGDYLFHTKYGPLLEAGEISYREALTQAAEEVTAVFQPQIPETVPANPRQQKEDRKKSIDNLPVAGARATRTAPAVETTDDVLAEMRRERGQPV
jgi:hypothetical protein